MGAERARKPSRRSIRAAGDGVGSHPVNAHTNQNRSHDATPAGSTSISPRRVLCRATGAAIPEGPSLPEHIQWMPPGKAHVVTEHGGETYEADVNCTPELCARMASTLDTMLETARAGNGDLPFTDFNHEDGAASSHPSRMTWGGDDPKTGGIRLHVEWTNAGKEAILGKTFRRFSPGFWVDPDTNEIVTLGTNVGGLVNRAAFRKIQPVWNKAKEIPTESMDEEMKNELKALGDRLAKLETALQEVAAKAKENPDPAARIVSIETQLAQMQAGLKAVGAKEAASALVREVAPGRIPAANPQILDSWIELVAKDAKNIELLKAIPENPALKTVVNVTAGAAKQQGATALADQSDAINAEIGAYRKATGCDYQTAWNAIKGQKPELFR